MLVTGSSRLDKSKTNQYTLSIRITSGGFCFYVHDSVHNVRLFDSTLSVNGGDPVSELRRFVSLNDFLTYEFASVQVIVDSPDCYSIPKIYFNNELLHQETRFILGEKTVGTVSLFNTFDHSDLYIAFTLNKAIYDYLKQVLAEPIFVHSVTSDYNRLIKGMVSNAEQSYHLIVHEGYITLLLTSGLKIEYVNCFPITSPDDIVYFTLHVTYQIDFNRNTGSLRLMNQSPAELNEIRSQLSKFFISVEEVVLAD